MVRRQAGDPGGIGEANRFAVLFLISPAASVITGQAIKVDGGLEMY